MSKSDSQRLILERIKSKPEMHFLSDKPNFGELVSKVIEEAVREGVTSFKAELIDVWWYLYFDKDWITDLNIEGYFNSPLKNDVGKAGGARSGIILNAFSGGLNFYSLNEECCIKGEKIKKPKLISPYICCLAFRLEE